MLAGHCSSRSMVLAQRSTSCCTARPSQLYRRALLSSSHAPPCSTPSLNTHSSTSSLRHKQPHTTARIACGSSCRDSQNIFQRIFDGFTRRGGSSPTITTLADLAAVFSQASSSSSSSSSKGSPVKLTIDLEGRTLVGEVPGSELRLEGEHAHVCLTNGSLEIPYGCRFKVEEGATLELLGLHITSYDWANESRAPVIVRADEQGTHLLLEDCSITAVGPERADIFEFSSTPTAVSVNYGAELTMRRCWIRGTFDGVSVSDSGTKAVVEACVATHCEISGFSSSYGGVLEAYRCIALRNGFSGFWAEHEGTVLRAVECRSERNVHAGFHAASRALMVVDACATSENGAYGFFAESGAQFSMIRFCELDEWRRAWIQHENGDLQQWF